MAYDQKEVERLEMLRAEVNAHAINKIRDKTYTMQDDAAWELESLCIDHDMALAKGFPK
jgi:hypothetical protein